MSSYITKVNIFFISVFNAGGFGKFNKFIYKTIEERLEDTITIDCQIIPESDLPKGYPRLLCTDQVLVIPSETPLRILVTGSDVIHS